jgi:hypothetical protein
VASSHVRPGGLFQQYRAENIFRLKPYVL